MPALCVCCRNRSNPQGSDPGLTYGPRPPPRLWSRVVLDELLLPRQQRVHAGLAVGGDAFERRTRSDEVRVDRQSRRRPDPVAA